MSSSAKNRSAQDFTSFRRKVTKRKCGIHMEQRGLKCGLEADAVCSHSLWLSFFPDSRQRPRWSQSERLHEESDHPRPFLADLIPETCPKTSSTYVGELELKGKAKYSLLSLLHTHGNGWWWGATGGYCCANFRPTALYSRSEALQGAAVTKTWLKGQR